jgi:quercetin dioxygenase-like cupin family protein
MIVKHLAGLAEFSSQKMVKTNFELGQEHAAHAHAGQDKLYVVLEGEAEIQVGDEKQLVSAGGGAFAPSGVMHSVRNRGETRLVVLAVLAPPPAQ